MGSVSKEEFIRYYSEHLREGTGAVFVGAGLSIPAGFVDWRTLLADIAHDLGLRIELEHDLIAVAQYEVNRKGNRDSINQAIIHQFGRQGGITDNHRLLARLPISTVWTTNYDRLLENAYEEANKRVDVKFTNDQLVLRKPYRDVVLFKMHGDVAHPNDAVLTKDDYECYETERGGFTYQLLADLMSLRFLFLGFSFTDPNIEYTFNRMRRLLNPHRKQGGLGKEHYCLLRSPNRGDYATDEEYRVNLKRFEHRIDDMQRFGISTVVLRDYSEITELLAILHRRISTRTVMVSGAADDYGTLGRERIESLCEDLGRRLIEEGYDIVCGVGKGIGAAIMVGANQALGRPDIGRIGQRLRLFPFPYWHPDEGARIAYGKRNRAEMAGQAGVSVFICGNRFRNRKTGGPVIESPGVMEEFEAAKTNGHIVIPIGATEHAARTVWEIVRGDCVKYYPNLDVSNDLDVLGNSNSTNSQLLDAVFGILSKASGA